MFYVSGEGKIDENTGGGMFYFQLGEDGGSVVGDEDVANVVDEHLVKTYGSKGCFDNVGHGKGGGDIALSYILA